MSMIPNPRKNIVVDFTISETKSAVNQIPTYFRQKYTLEKQNEILNQSTFGALEFLSLGVFIDINLNAISENKTDIIIEVRRKIGAFDKTFEVSKANTHLDDLFNGLSILLGNIRKHSAPISTENPTTVLQYNLSWDDIKTHLNSLVSTYPNTYKLISDDGVLISLRRFPQAGDNIVLQKDAILNIKKLNLTEDGTEVKFEITNDENRISTFGELERNKLIIRVTTNLLGKKINPSEKHGQLQKAKATDKAGAFLFVIIGLAILCLLSWFIFK